MRTHTVPVALLVLTLRLTCAGQEWVSLFDGKTMNGWQPSEHKDTWRVEDGALVSRGARSHLFYNGEVRRHDFKNFEVRAEVKTRPGSNSGIYIHTHYQESGFPETGYKCQVINSNTNNQPGAYVERKLTASIYAIHNVWKAPAPDNEWFRYRAVVRGKTIQTFINDELMAEYTESAHPYRPGDKQGRLLSSGTFALQGHDAGSVVAFRKIEVKVLPDDLPTPGTPTDDPVFDAKIIQLSDDNFPLVDLDVRLGNGLTLDQALAHSREFGYTYGFVFEHRSELGFRMPRQAYLGFHYAGAGDARLGSMGLSQNGVDYVMTDAIDPTETIGPIVSQSFMDLLIGRIEQLARGRRAIIWARATALPDSIKADYEALWTPQRMDRAIKALKEGKIAVEINDRLRTPSAAFIRRAKAGGVRFTFGSDNTGPGDLGRLRYCVEMITECALTPEDIWTP